MIAGDSGLSLPSMDEFTSPLVSVEMSDTVRGSISPLSLVGSVDTDKVAQLVSSKCGISDVFLNLIGHKFSSSGEDLPVDAGVEVVFLLTGEVEVNLGTGMTLGMGRKLISLLEDEVNISCLRLHSVGEGFDSSDTEPLFIVPCTKRMFCSCGLQ